MAKDVAAITAARGLSLVVAWIRKPGMPQLCPLRKRVLAAAIAAVVSPSASRRHGDTIKDPSCGDGNNNKMLIIEFR